MYILHIQLYLIICEFYCKIYNNGNNKYEVKSMEILNHLLKHLGKSVASIQVASPPHNIPDNIVLLDGNTPVKPGSICIGGHKDILYTIKNFTIPRGTIFFIPVTKSAASYKMPNINIVETSLSMIELYNRLNTALKALNISKATENGTAFDAFFRNIVSMKLTNADEIKSALYETEFVSDDAYNIIVVEFMNPEISDPTINSIKTDVLQIFPSSNITFYANRLVIMYQHPGRVIHLPMDQLEKFTQLLIKYDAHAGISNHTLNFEMIRTEYIIAKSILNISKGMFRKTKRRIFTQEEHGTFYIMDLCYRQCEQVFHHNNMLYLCHPGLAALIRYDNEHKTNLRKVLLCYLLNDRSLAKTSKILYMHRNTTMNKINKISEIIDDNLEDALIRQRLLFSCLFYDYCEKFKQQTFNVYIDDSENTILPDISDTLNTD